MLSTVLSAIKSGFGLGLRVMAFGPSNGKSWAAYGPSFSNEKRSYLEGHFGLEALVLLESEKPPCSTVPLVGSLQCMTLLTPIGSCSKDVESASSLRLEP